MRVAVIIPARNEADALGQVLAELPHRLVHEIVVIFPTVAQSPIAANIIAASALGITLFVTRSRGG